jgi:hypothetical protein
VSFAATSANAFYCTIPTSSARDAGETRASAGLSAAGRGWRRRGARGIEPSLERAVLGVIDAVLHERFDVAGVGRRLQFAEMRLAGERWRWGTSLVVGQRAHKFAEVVDEAAGAQRHDESVFGMV